MLLRASPILSLLIIWPRSILLNKFPTTEGVPELSIFIPLNMFCKTSFCFNCLDFLLRWWNLFLLMNDGILLLFPRNTKLFPNLKSFLWKGWKDLRLEIFGILLLLYENSWELVCWTKQTNRNIFNILFMSVWFMVDPLQFHYLLLYYKILLFTFSIYQH